MKPFEETIEVVNIGQPEGESAPCSMNTYVVRKLSGGCSLLHCVDFVGPENLGDGIMCKRKDQEIWVAHYHLPRHLKEIDGRGTTDPLEVQPK